MHRKQEKTLIEWKNRSNRKPLVIRGARQVGKTYLVREFAGREYQHYIEINFDETPGKRELFSYDDINKVIQYISLDSGIPVVPGKTLIFLDEIQRAPEIFAKLRYFYEKRNDIHIIAAGSLIDFILEAPTFSMPVGRIEYMYMGPMDFMEYLKEMGADNLYNFIRGYSPGDDLPLPIHEKILDLLRTYMSVGGMPASVREYIQSSSPRQCEMELNSILGTYRDDFSKYLGKADPETLRLVLDKAPGLIGRKVKYTEISREIPSGRLKVCLRQLEQARVLHRVHHSSGNAVPLRAEKKERVFKLLFVDSGLMMRSLGLNILSIHEKKILLANSGALAEQFIGQQWFNNYNSYEEPELFYWNREKSTASAEVDYLFQVDDAVIPVEVKAGTMGSLKSLHVFSAEKRSPLALRFNLARPEITKVTSRIPGKPVHPFSLISLPMYMISETRRIIRTL